MMTKYMYCPACGGEFEDNMEYCPHCAAPLVEKRDLPEVKIADGAASEGEAVVYVSGDMGEAGQVAEALRREGLQVQVYSVNTRAAGLTFTPRTLLHVAVPAAQADRALSALRYGLSTQATDANLSEDLSKKMNRLEAAIQAEEAGLPALEEFFSDAPELRQRAMDAALEFVEGVDVLINWVVRICLEQELADGLMRAVGEACSLLGEEEPELAAREMAPGLKSPDAWVRKNFCFALGKLGADMSISLLVDALLDPSPEVRNEAMDQLYVLEGTSLGYDPDLEPEEQREALAKWRELASRLEQR
jgi:hypothetical protein